MKKTVITIITLFIFLFISNYSHALCISVSDANLRTGPGTKYEKSWEVFKYMPFKKASKKGNWYKVKDMDGDRHWVYSKLVTSKYKCAAVKAAKANVRTGPGTKYAISSLSPALKYDSFKVLKNQKKWVKIVDEFGDTGWIFKKLLWIQ